MRTILGIMVLVGAVSLSAVLVYAWNDPRSGEPAPSRWPWADSMRENAQQQRQQQLDNLQRYQQQPEALCQCNRR